MGKFILFELKRRYRSFFLLLSLFLIENIYFYNRFKFEPLESIKRDFFFGNFLLTLGAFTAFIFFRNYIYINDLITSKSAYMLLMTNIKRKKILISEYLLFLIEFLIGFLITFSSILWQGNRIGLFIGIDKNYLSLYEYFYNTPNNYLLQKYYLYNFILFVSISFALTIFVLIFLKVINKEKSYTKFKIGIISLLFFLIKGGVNKYLLKFKSIEEYLYGTYEGTSLVSRSVPLSPYLVDIFIIVIILFFSAIYFEKKLDI